MSNIMKVLNVKGKLGDVKLQLTADTGERLAIIGSLEAFKEFAEQILSMARDWGKAEDEGYMRGGLKALEEEP